MSGKTILLCAAACAVALVWGYRRGLVAGASRADSGPVVGGGTDWLSWQGD